MLLNVIGEHLLWENTLQHYLLVTPTTGLGASGREYQLYLL